MYKIESLSRAGDIDIVPANRNYYVARLFHRVSCFFACAEEIDLPIIASR